MKLIAQFTTTVQVTEDHWVEQRRTLEVTDQTTIAELIKWLDNNKLSIDRTNGRKIEIFQLD